VDRTIHNADAQAIHAAINAALGVRTERRGRLR
jgi:hypothetical protein